MPASPDSDDAPLTDIERMASVIAHELRNPLAAVRGALEIVGGRVAQDPANARVIAQVIARVDSLDELVDDMLLFSLTPPLRRASVDLEQVLRDAAGRVLRDAGLSDCDLETRGSAPCVQADATLLRSAFRHLLLNAAQAMRGRGVITVTFGYAPPDLARVEIADHGPGLSDAARAHLFQPFFTSKARGAGLGLPIAKRLIERHGGALTMLSTDDGARVSVTIPVAADTPSDAGRGEDVGQP